MVAAVFQSFYYNQTPYKTDNSLRRTTDTEIINGHLRSVFNHVLLVKILPNFVSTLSKVSQRPEDTCIPSLLTKNNDILTDYFSANMYGH